MRKLLLVLLLLIGANTYSQNYNSQIKQLKEKLLDELKKDYDTQDSIKIKKLRGKISFLKSNYETLIAVYDFEKQIFTTDQLKPKHKQPIVLKITNINKIANKVEITASDIKIKDDFLDPDEEIVSAIINENNPKEEIKAVALEVNLEVPAGIEEGKEDKSKLKSLEKGMDLLMLEINTLDISIQTNKKRIEIEKIKQLDLKRKEIKGSEESEIIETSEYKDIQTKIDSLNVLILNAELNILTKQQDFGIKQNEVIKMSDDIGKFKVKTNSLLEKYSAIYKSIKDINKINSTYNNFIDYMVLPSTVWV